MGRRLSPVRLSPAPKHMLQTPVQIVTRTNDLPTGCRLEVPTTLSLGSISLPEWLTELKEIFYFLNDQFIVEGCNSGTAR